MPIFVLPLPLFFFPFHPDRPDLWFPFRLPPPKEKSNVSPLTLVMSGPTTRPPTLQFSRLSRLRRSRQTKPLQRLQLQPPQHPQPNSDPPTVHLPCHYRRRRSRRRRPARLPSGHRSPDILFGYSMWRADHCGERHAVFTRLLPDCGWG